MPLYVLHKLGVGGQLGCLGLLCQLCEDDLLVLGVLCLYGLALSGLQDALWVAAGVHASLVAPCQVQELLEHGNWFTSKLERVYKWSVSQVLDKN